MAGVFKSDGALCSLIAPCRWTEDLRMLSRPNDLDRQHIIRRQQAAASISLSDFGTPNSIEIDAGGFHVSSTGTPSPFPTGANAMSGPRAHRP